MLNLNEVHLGDSLELLKGIPDKSIDLVLTDPPYNIRKAEWDKWKTKESYIEWCGQWITECQRVLKDNGSFYSFHNDMTQISMLMEWVRKNTRFVFKSFITVNKTSNNYIIDLYGSQKHFRNYLNIAEYCLFYTFQDETGLTTVKLDLNNFPTLRGYFKEYQEALGMNIKQINSILGHRKAEHAFYCGSSQWDLPTKETYAELAKLPLKHEFVRKECEDLRKEYEGLRKEYEGLRYTFNAREGLENVWAYEFRTEKHGHPTQKPLKLIKDVMTYSRSEGDIVLDPFMGSGTTAVAAIELNRKFIGIEKVPEYKTMADKRIQNAIDKKGLFSEVV